MYIIYTTKKKAQIYIIYSMNLKSIFLIINIAEEVFSYFIKSMCDLYAKCGAF